MDYTIGFTVVVVFFLPSGYAQGIQCDQAPPIPHGNVKYLSGGRIVQYFCDPGYQPFGAPMLSCFRGQWRGKEPICVAPGCHPAIKPLHSTRYEQMKGAVIKHKCTPGFRMQGQAVIYCDGFYWSSPSPICERISSDILPTAPPYPPENAIEDPGNASLGLTESESVYENSHGMAKPIFVGPSDKPPVFNAGYSKMMASGGVLPLYRVAASDDENEYSEEGDESQTTHVQPPQERRMPPANIPTQNQNLRPPMTRRIPQQAYPPYLPQGRRDMHIPQYGRPYQRYSNRYDMMLPPAQPPYMSQYRRQPIYPPYITSGSSMRQIYLNRDDQGNPQSTGGVGQPIMQPNSREETPVASERLPSNFGNVGQSVPSLVQNRRNEHLPRTIEKEEPAVGEQRPPSGRLTQDGYEKETVPGVLQVAVPTQNEEELQSSGHHRSCPPPPKPIRGYHITRPLPRDYDGDKYLYLVEYRCLTGLKLIGGDNTSYCMTNGRWTGRLPRCEKIRTCEAGFVQQLSGRCADINECAEDNGGCVQRCLNYPGSFFCRCHNGYQLSGDGVTCTEIDECSPTREKICNHFCQNTPGSFKCSCREGYSLMTHDNRTCLDVNECLTSSPCDHLCQNTFGSFRCACRSNFRLNEDGRTCSEICQPGYIMKVEEETNEKSCSDENECLEHDGLGNCEQVCNNTAGSYFCSCSPGFKLNDDEQTCSDINECEELSPCDYGCINEVGSYSCSCPQDQVLSEDGLSCAGCQKDSYMDDRECVLCPDGSGTTDIGALNRGQCICKPGYRGSPEMNIPCTDIDECEDANYGCSHSCVNTPGSVFCGCLEGYKLDLDGRNCKDADECNDLFGVCGRGGFCRNTDGGYNCSCLRGYRPDPRKPNGCVDIDECQINNGGCQVRCLNLRPGYQCSCYTNWRLDRDGRSCIPLRGSCTPLKPLPNGRVLPEVPCVRIDTVIMRRVCFYACNSGYKLVGGNRVQCAQNGWTGTPPQCVAEGRCPPLDISPGVRVIPPRCAQNSSLPWGICVFSCEDPSHMMKGRRSTRCIPNNRWEHEPPTCVVRSSTVTGVSSLPRIQCPRDLDVDLAPGEATATVTLPKPVTNMKITEQRNDGSASRDMFPAGITSIKFTAFTPDRHRHASCVMRVHVRDKEAPTIQRCPGSISLESTHEFPEISWKPPLFSDNVGVKNVKESRFPRGNITWGSYSVSYTASDSAGNMAECAFTVTIRRPKASRRQGIEACGRPEGPRNGRAMCQAWARGVYCIPTCDARYAFERMPPTYVCDDQGVWTPGRVIPDCVDMRSARRPVSPTITPKIPRTTAHSVIVSYTPAYFPVTTSTAETYEPIPDSDQEPVSDTIPEFTTLGEAARTSTPKLKILKKPAFILLPIQESGVNSRKRPILMAPEQIYNIRQGVSQPRLIKLTPDTTDCPMGHVPQTDESGRKTCAQCPVGRYRPRIASAVECLPCLPGYYQDRPGKGYCKQCPNYLPRGYASEMRGRKELIGLKSLEDCERIEAILGRSVRDAAVRRALARRRLLLRNR